ncbi:hypothetical protein WMY93_005124 [Mugilogobius chulae]|uniref:Kinesin-like protein n=1 Tax=Mugilogobius chulae TaxID=88201 RepID=A0AAW0Q1L2_9GOBI
MQTDIPVAWEATSPTSEEPGVSPRPIHVKSTAAVLEELPGSVPERREDRPHPKAHNTQVEHYRENRKGVTKSEPALHAASSQDMKIYIPYESAEMCVTQIAHDIERLESKHREIVKELESSFKATARENQECVAHRIRSHYQNKLISLKKMLQIYQEKVEKKNVDLDKQVVALSAQNRQLLEEQRSERRRSEEEALQWQREKSKIMEMFSNRLDMLHQHQASTLQELQMARQEVGKVQEMLVQSAQAQEAKEAAEAEACNESKTPLEGAKLRLEELKESLYKREREITELLESQSPVPPVPLPPCTVLLSRVIQKANAVCRASDESKALLAHMIEENQINLKQSQNKLSQLETEGGDKDRSEENESQLSLLQETVKELEVSQLALFCIKTGQVPAIRECDAITELEDILGQGTIQTLEGVKRFAEKFVVLQDEMKLAKEEKIKIIENYTSERTLRKKYYNMIEDMKGKIRVFCRIRPVNQTEAAQNSAVVVEKIDDFSVNAETPRGPREFQFDKVFSAEATQEDLFQDACRLIQSAIDGYNVCIFAYGQTGSGKTYTMVGDKEKKNPGIMPRSFNAIFDIIRENNTKFEFKVSAYMLELYNDRLQDLFASAGGEGQAQGKRVEIKRNRKGVVFAQGAVTKEASSAQQLYALFQQACANRHIAATKMNVESSRSHLIVGIKVESKNLTNGSVSTGKLSLVDLAGSERAAKTGAKDHKLKEANSINKSLSALGM